MPRLVTASTLLLTALLTACASGGPDTGPAGVYGEALSMTDTVTVDELLAGAADHDGQALRVTGTVEEVCPMKGCWMTFAAGDETMRVTFQDYGFFMPKDIAGRTVTFEGTFAISEVSEADARHYLEDAGKHEEAAAIHGPQQSFTFVATGVELHGEG